MTSQWYIQLRDEYICDWNRGSVFIPDQIIEKEIWEMKERKKNDDEYTSEDESDNWENQSIER